MHKLFLLLFFSLFHTVALAQQKEAADKLVQEGTADHDKGEYKSALAKYDRALQLDKDNLLALSEKAYTLMFQEKYEESAFYAEKAITNHPGEEGLKTVYITYGNALDALQKPEKALEIYNTGIKQFPDFYMLYFNKGVTLSGVQKYNQAILCFQKAVVLHPEHPGSHNGMARLLDEQEKDIPALLAYCRFLVLEPQEKRGQENLTAVQKIIQGNVEKIGRNEITINIEQFPEDSIEAVKPNNFAAIELMISLSTALVMEKKSKQTEVEQFINKFETVCDLLKTQKDGNTGFYWDYYAPYFIEMYDKKQIETFSYIAFASSNQKDVVKWLKNHQKEVGEFYTWSEGFIWKK